MKWPMLHFAIDDLQAAIRAGLACKHPPDLPRYLTLTKEQEDEMALRVAVANAYLQQRANELDTALAALLPWEDRGMLGPWLMALDDVDVNALALAKGWRYDVCGHVLCAYRRGDLNLSITPVAAATTTITTTATDAQQS
ncbi:hypothetical protein PTSG_10841 [Salpingoeca rosetta]|uniref:Uncharacterized protein n=1 Tax=Salpingoeca rosetta (strain ATCC 50818 / BSB-021) TaxID=946362 RepID=F2URJ0_SALR5|nr:uncharacterized protein PTSG_10841 [Salpingoeca rosetta]EGD80159.1 hypothetical protein PTSG_10841 [Salpingoeca rosetta]|eukprot:XP_004988221.1 hypothetical protein PTSG_10841 [Salpingoeca rosetta]